MLNRTATQRHSRLYFAALGLIMLSLGACTELPTAPSAIDRVQAEAVLPAVIDARLRLTSNFNIPSQQKLVLTLSSLETALRQGDGATARGYLADANNVLNAYDRQSFNSVSPDVSAILLTLNAVAIVVDSPTHP